MSRLWVAAGVLALSAPAFAQDPVRWSGTVGTQGIRASGTFDVSISGVADDEWHVYSLTQGPGGPIPTTIAIRGRQPFAQNGAIRGPEPTTAFDRNFDIQTETYDGTFTLVVPLRILPDAPGTAATLRVSVGYQACTNRLCLPPRTVVVSVPMRWTGPSPSLRSGSGGASPQPASVAPRPQPGNPPPPPRPAVASFGAAAESLSGFLWLAITMGAWSLLTPCVFPMVPITVSYFTKHAAPTRSAALGRAALYGLGIVLTFTVLGGALAAVAGAAGLNRFAASPWVNLGIAALFVTFAVNLFGLYELRLPVRLMSRLDGMSRRRGGTSAIGTLLMALTFTITSLTCTAAFLGTLLVVAAQGEWQRPIVGLLAYSATFALPFVALAMTPQLVSQLPRSGPWLARVKVVMGFLEIAAAMKFLSNADLVWSWGVFTRPVVLIVWIATAVLLAGYLLGRRPGTGRLAAGITSLALAVWLATGVSGRQLGELEAFLPAATLSAERSAKSGELPWLTDDLGAALVQARQSGKLIIIDFTGYTCTNCRWMEANMFPRPDVRAALGGFVRARLYTDGQRPIDEKQQRYQQERFATVALPLYAIIDADQRPIATFAGLTRDPREFLRFLAQR